MVSERENALRNFWTKFKKSHHIVLDDIYSLENLMNKVFLRIEELELSREKWKNRALQAESKLKECERRCKNVDKS